MSADFIDTNVVLYLFDETDDRKRQIAERIIYTGVTTSSVVVSHQVVQEAMSALLTKQLTPQPLADARKLLDEVLIPLWSARLQSSLYRLALDVHDRYRYRFYDALIIASAMETGCERLLSEDFQHGQRIGTLTIENPFLP